MFVRCICVFASLSLAQYVQAVTTYTFVIDQELSKVVHSIDLPINFPTVVPTETFQISGSFNLVVDTSTDIYFYPTARLSALNIEVDPQADPDFLFPSYFLRNYTEVDSETATFFGTDDGCDEFNARRDRGGTCWSWGQYRFVSGMLEGTSLHLEGINPIGEFTLPGYDLDVNQSYEYDIHATLATPVSGDIDLDFDVDGNDFLLWQRAPSNSGLTDWLTHFGTPPAAGLAGIETIPEPTALLLLTIGLALFFHRHRSAKLLNV